MSTLPIIGSKLTFKTPTIDDIIYTPPSDHATFDGSSGDFTFDGGKIQALFHFEWEIVKWKEVKYSGTGTVPIETKEAIAFVRHYALKDGKVLLSVKE